MYSLYHQIHPPTGIEHCLYCKFIDVDQDNLVIAGVNQISVYRLNSDLEPLGKSQEKAGDKTVDTQQKKHKLECLATYQLFGNVESMQSVHLAGSPRDALLVSFSEAKLSMLEFDPSTHDLKTSSMHHFEEEELKGGFINNSSSVPYVRVDPEGRCAAMLVYKTHLVILPFRKDAIGEESDHLMGTGSGSVMSTYIIDLRKLDEKITNVVDFQFLHGYYEPTILFLYEPLPTWTGRIAVRKDSCSIVAISLNIQERVHPIIWSLGNLPYDCLQAVAVPKPIGGVLIFAVNSLLYLNQSFPPYGVALNSLTLVSTDFLLKTQEGVKITLDCAHASFISFDKMVISLRGGEIYVLTLLIDSMRAVRSFNLDKAAASVLTTCMCQCGDGYLFLGSRLGNSLLLKYTEKSTDDVRTHTLKVPSMKEVEEDELFAEPPQKKMKDDIGAWMAKDVSQIDDLDELEVYGRGEAHPLGSLTQLALYTFEVCDSIMNIGPCSRMVMGEPAFLSEEFSNTLDPDIELVTTSGYGKNGAISVLQRSIRPQVVTTFELPGCIDMWTVIGSPAPKKKSEGGDEESEDKPEQPEDTKQEQPENAHSFLIISREDSSLILQTGQEIMELDHSGFSTQGPTVFAGNIGDGRYIIQVSQTGVRLMDGVDQLQHIVLDVNSPIVCCSVADPNVILLSAEGEIRMLILKQDSFGGGVRLVMSSPKVHQGPKVITLCTYKDMSGMFTCAEESKTTLTEAPVKDEEEDLYGKTEADDEDELLYGGDTSMTEENTVKTDDQSFTAKPEPTKQPLKDIQPTYWLALARENGNLEIYTLPEMKLSFSVKSFAMGLKLLVDSMEQADVGIKVSSNLSNEKLLVSQVQDIPIVHELLLVGLGNKGSRPHLLARVDEELYVYEAFSYSSGKSDDHLNLRFKKVQHGLIIKARQSKYRNRQDKAGDDAKSMADRVRWLRPFSDISGYSGVFVCGPYPHWLFISSRGLLRSHPFSIDGTITCFSPFHNINCPKGFLYFNRKGELRISVLPTHVSYDAPWPVRKVPLRCIPHFVVYHPESKTYSVVSSVEETCNRVVKLVGDGDKEFETQEKDDRFIYPCLEKFSIQLFSPVSWEPIPNTKLDFEDFEHITCIKYVILKSEGTISGFKGYIAVGTNYNYNEEVTSRGRILIYDVIEVVPEPGQPLTKNKMKIEYDKEQKGPVSALEHVKGFLVTAMGQKIYIWQLKDQDLSGVAFIDTQVYIHTLATIKNMILAADICKSIMLLRYQEDMKVLSVVSRDVKPLEVYDVGYLVDNTTLCMLVSDRMKNLLVYSYQPEVRESHGGQRLIRKADFNAGSHINTFFRMKCKRSDPSSERPASGIVEKRHVTYFATLDGSIGYLLPVTEKMYRRFSMVQNALTTHLPHIAGLNPKAYRLVQDQFRTLSNPHKNILDGDLLWYYLHLSVSEKNELAKRIGTTVEQIIEDLMEIDRHTAHF